MYKNVLKCLVCNQREYFNDVKIIYIFKYQGSKKVPSGMPDGQGYGQAARELS